MIPFPILEGGGNWIGWPERRAAKPSGITATPPAPIGMTGYQEGVPVRGDYQFRPSTWHSIELNAPNQDQFHLIEPGPKM